MNDKAKITVEHFIHMIKDCIEMENLTDDEFYDFIVRTFEKVKKRKTNEYPKNK